MRVLEENLAASREELEQYVQSKMAKSNEAFIQNIASCVEQEQDRFDFLERQNEKLNEEIIVVNTDKENLIQELKEKEK